MGFVGAAIKEAIADRPGWGIVERAVLTTSSFQKEAIYRDLTDNAETILADPHVQLHGLGPDPKNPSRSRSTRRSEFGNLRPRPGNYWRAAWTNPAAERFGPDPL